MTSGTALAVVRFVPRRSTGVQSRSPMIWHKHPFVRSKLVMLEHAGDVLFLVVCAYIIGEVLKKVFPSGLTLWIVDGMESVSIIIIFGLFIAKLVQRIYNI